MTSEVALTVNGAAPRRLAVPDSERLLDTLRWRLGLKGTKEGCRTGDCGACTVLVDGETTLSCLTLTHEVQDRAVTTVEGIAEDPEGRRVLAAFAAEDALQCGYCTPGFVVSLTGIRKELGASAPDSAVIEALQGNLCRCTGYLAIVRAVARIGNGNP
ncbi:MAG: (2Fe-2S)-binding protein [Thermoplasmata archaeon]|nr:(2Fe-2S)-binding protein [Thermoplasmata archaeon]MCI4356388.1 (2Fe-2S)-binding protein [Thermoplasmata archaeon]